MKSSKKVVVLGASGVTGKLCMKMLIGKSITCRGIVRSEAKKSDFLKNFGNDVDIKLADITKDSKKLEEAFTGFETLIVATSAVPKIEYMSLFGVIGRLLIGQRTSPRFYFREGQSPMIVDYFGQKNIFENAKKAGIKHVILISTMYAADPKSSFNSLLQQIGLWKRKSEIELINSGLDYTIIHPGRLSFLAGRSKNMLVGVNDSVGQRKTGSRTPREDVARVATDSVGLEVAIGKSFDLVHRDGDQGFDPQTTTEKMLEKGLEGLEFDYSKPNLYELVKVDEGAEKSFLMNLA